MELKKDKNNKITHKIEIHNKKTNVNEKKANSKY